MSKLTSVGTGSVAACKARGQIDRVPDNGIVDVKLGINLRDDHQTGVNSHPKMEIDAVLLL